MGYSTVFIHTHKRHNRTVPCLSPRAAAAAALGSFAAFLIVQIRLSTSLPEEGVTLLRPTSPLEAPLVDAALSRSNLAHFEDAGVHPPSMSALAPRSRHLSVEWAEVSSEMDDCLSRQEALMTVPVEWPGFHALCISHIDARTVSVLVHARSGRKDKADESGSRTRVLSASIDATALSQNGAAGLVDALVRELKHELQASEFLTDTDPMISTSDYEFPANPWKLFNPTGGAVEEDADLNFIGRGGAVYLFTGGQFIWPGVRIGHVTKVPIPVGGDDGKHKIVEMKTVSLRPLVFVLSEFLSDEECEYIKRYGASRMQPSRLATMDSTATEEGVRTSTQTFMTRGGSAEIRALEERAHNLTRLPYELGENIQVLRYMEGQKYGAHRDFFNPNDYHKQPSMLRSVDYGGRNRMATVFWYLESVEEGGETYFPRALNEHGVEYHPWNGDHDDCYRGIAVKPVRGNAVLFYSIVPDGRLDERSLHGGCRPRDGGEKWGANQWIWNHPNRVGLLSPVPPRRGRQVSQADECADSNEHCVAWARNGECQRNAAYMHGACAHACKRC